MDSSKANTVEKMAEERPPIIDTENKGEDIHAEAPPPLMDGQDSGEKEEDAYYSEWTRMYCEWVKDGNNKRLVLHDCPLVTVEDPRNGVSSSSENNSRNNRAKKRTPEVAVSIAPLDSTRKPASRSASPVDRFSKGKEKLTPCNNTRGEVKALSRALEKSRKESMVENRMSIARSEGEGCSYPPARRGYASYKEEESQIQRAIEESRWESETKQRESVESSRYNGNPITGHTRTPLMRETNKRRSDDCHTQAVSHPMETTNSESTSTLPDKRQKTDEPAASSCSKMVNFRNFPPLNLADKSRVGFYDLKLRIGFGAQRSVMCRDDFSNDTNTGGAYFQHKCNTCTRSFATHQALGGHRSSCKGSRDGVETAYDGARNVLGGHRCRICNRAFLSGQALGGHMTLHRQDNAPPSVEVEVPTIISSTPTSPTYDTDQKELFDLDLNQPPVIGAEDDLNLAAASLTISLPTSVSLSFSPPVSPSHQVDTVASNNTR